jgi:peptide/nickel transport system substrate-binding protein
MVRLTRRTFTAGSAALAFARSARAEVPKHGSTLVATYGGGEPQACYVPSGGGPGPTFTASKALERLGRRQLSGAFAGELAEGWTPAGDFRSYAIKLRQGVRFHDGRPMGTADVVYSIDEIWKQHAAADMLADYTGCEVPDANTVVMRFSKPVPAFFFASLLSATDSYILPKHLYAGSDPLANPANNAPVGTGPWKFKEWVRGSHVEYVRNAAYWRSGLPYLDRLVLRFLRDPAARAAAMEAGEVQLGVFNPLPPADLRRFAAGTKFVATAKGYDEAVWATTLDCNLRRPLLQKREVRQAIFQAIDRMLIAKAVYSGYARPGTGPIFSPNTEYFTPDTFSTEHDPRTAAALLDGAGLPKKADGKRFTLDLVAGGWFADNGKVGILVKQGLEDVGIGVNLSVPNRTASIQRLYTDYDFDLAISNQVNGSEPVPATTRLYTSDGIKKGVPFANASGFSNEEVDALVAQIRIETDPAKRKAAVVEFQKIITREAPSLPLVELETLTLANARLQNHSNDPNFLAASWHDLWLAS